jgi:hypothetical protein
MDSAYPEPETQPVVIDLACIKFWSPYISQWAEHGTSTSPVALVDRAYLACTLSA